MRHCRGVCVEAMAHDGGASGSGRRESTVNTGKERKSGRDMRRERRRRQSHTTYQCHSDRNRVHRNRIVNLSCRLLSHRTIKRPHLLYVNLRHHHHQHRIHTRTLASMQSPSSTSSSPPPSPTSASMLIPDLSDRLTLDNIRTALIRQEDTIIFSLIERSQFRRNDEIYQAGSVSVPCFDSKTGEMKSLLEFTLREIEQLHGKLRRYTSPDERAFFADKLPPLMLKPLDFPSVLMPWINTINMNDVIYDEYIAKIVPAVTQAGTDNNFGSTVIADVTCLQSLSKRTHMGMFVAEAKFRSNRELYTRLIRDNDREAIMESLTDATVEERVANRVRNKTATYGQNVDDVLPDLKRRMDEMMNEDFKVAPEIVADLYVNWLMPLTKRVQVEYFMQRLDFDDDEHVFLA